MLAEVREELIFKVVDPAVIPELKESPKRMIICIVIVLLGGLISIIGVLTCHISHKLKGY